MRLPAALAVLGLALQIQQLPPRDPGLGQPPPAPTGTAAITGRVVTGDGGTPVSNAVVSLLPAPQLNLSTSPATSGGVGATVTVGTPPDATGQNIVLMTTAVGRPQSVTTDNQGAFVFRDLPAGSYRLRAAPSQYEAQYLAVVFGAKKPNGPGSQDFGRTLTVADGQTLEGVTLTLPRGCVIAGQVTDENGTPLARVQIRGTLYSPSVPRGLSVGGASTDDRGQFRLFGLQPGDYLIAAQAPNGTFMPPNQKESSEPRIGFLTTFFPGTPDEGAAQRVHVDTGAEVAGVDIRMASGRLFHIEGTVVDSQGRPVRASGSLAQGNGTASMMGGGFGTDPQGHFQMQNVQPGEYRLVVRAAQIGPQGPQATGQPAPQEMAVLPLSVQDDIENVLVRLSPGVTITGQVTFDSGLPPLPAGMTSPRVSVMVAPGDPVNMPGIGNVRGVAAESDLTFTLKGLMGEYLVRGNTDGASLKSVLLDGGVDITDTPHEFKDGDHVVLVMTTRTSVVQGTVTDGTGAPVTDALVILFPEDQGAWRQNSTRVRRATTDQNGQFRLTGVLAGQYLIVPESQDAVTPLTDASEFAPLAKLATSVVVNESEQRTVDLKLLSQSGGL